LKSLSFFGSIQFVDALDKIARNLNLNKRLTELNLGGCAFSLNSVHLLGKYIIWHGSSLKDLNLSQCKISYQGTRYIIDALNRNTSIRYFNFSYNDMASQLYEFSIKIGAVITRHPNLMHVDITKTGLKREEVIFIGLALTMSKTMLSLHMSANELPYYDRIFLRSLMAAKVGYGSTGSHGQKNNKEFGTIMQLAGGDNYNPHM
jgi:hypothetical protein